MRRPRSFSFDHGGVIQPYQVLPAMGVRVAGSIPSELAQLHKLTTLSFAWGSQLTNTIPTLDI